MKKYGLLYYLPIHLFACSLISIAHAQPRTNGVGPGGHYYPIHDFRDDFQVYDEVTKAYVPYIGELHAGQTALSAYVDLESNRHYSLLVSTRQPAYLFINAALRRKIPANQWVVLRIDSLYRIYRQPEIFLTLYGSPGLDDKQLFIGYPKSDTRQAIVLRDDNLSVKPRNRSVYDDFLGVGMLFLLATHAFLFTFYHRAFLRFYNLRDLLSLRAQEESFLINRPLSSTNILFVLNLSFLVAYLALLVQSRNPGLLISAALLPGEPRFGWLAGSFLLVSGLAFLALMGKYVALEIMGSLYKLQSITNIHFFKVLQSSLLFFTCLATVVALVVYNTSATDWPKSALLLPLLGFYLTRLFLLYAVIRSVEPIKNLYLFSYLCIVELIPLVIGLRFAL